MNKASKGIATFLLGTGAGLVLAFSLAVYSFVNIADWLVVDDPPIESEIAVILGGGGGSRLRAGLSIYDSGVVSRLVLVNKSNRAWQHIQANLCPECITEGKDVVFLEGSTDTFSDARLVEEYCSAHGIASILLITDPYHTRRASIVFKSQFKESAIKVSVTSSGDFTGRLSPQERWWEDHSTTQVLLSEISKISVMFFQKIRHLHS